MNKGKLDQVLSGAVLKGNIPGEIYSKGREQKEKIPVDEVGMGIPFSYEGEVYVVVAYDITVHTVSLERTNVTKYMPYKTMVTLV